MHFLTTILNSKQSTNFIQSASRYTKNFKNRNLLIFLSLNLGAGKGSSFKPNKSGGSMGFCRYILIKKKGHKITEDIETESIKNIPKK